MGLSTEEAKNKLFEIYYMNVSDLFIDSYIPDRDYSEESLAELSASIKEHGLIFPINVIKRKDKYEVVDGIRRWKATILAGFTEIPVYVRHCWAEIVTENTAAQDYNAYLTDNNTNADFNELIEKAFLNNIHTIYLPFEIENEFGIQSSLNKFIEKHPEYDLNVFLIIQEELDSNKIKERVKNINSFLYSFHPGFWPLPSKKTNGWEIFDKMICDMQIKKCNDTEALVWEVDGNRTTTIECLKGKYEGLLSVLRELDEGDWIMGLDYVDIRNMLFGIGRGEYGDKTWEERSKRINTFELYYMEWKNLSQDGDLTEIENNIKDTIKKKNKKPVQMAYILCGEIKFSAFTKYGKVLNLLEEIVDEYGWGQGCWKEGYPLSLHLFIRCK